MKLSSRAFTLIELLVVIAIIGTLAGIVVVKLGAARGDGKDAAVKADLGNIQVQGALYYTISNSFGAATSNCLVSNGSVFKDTTTTIEDSIGSAIVDATKNAKGNVIFCQAAQRAFAVGAMLDNGRFWCIDSRGAAREVTSITAGTFDATTPLCPAS